MSNPKVTKQTSSEVSSAAAKLLDMSKAPGLRFHAYVGGVWQADVTELLVSVAASALSQDEKSGQKPKRYKTFVEVKANRARARAKKAKKKSRR